LKTYEYLIFFLSCFGSKDPKKTQIDFGRKQMEKQMDVLYLIKKLTELEKLKILLLTPQ
jgi:hypothetical protein